MEFVKLAAGLRSRQESHSHPPLARGRLGENASFLPARGAQFTQKGRRPNYRFGIWIPVQVHMVLSPRIVIGGNETA